MVIILINLCITFLGVLAESICAAKKCISGLTKTAVRAKLNAVSHKNKNVRNNQSSSNEAPCGGRMTCQPAGQKTATEFPYSAHGGFQGCLSGQSRRRAVSASIVYLYKRIYRPGTILLCSAYYDRN